MTTCYRCGQQGVKACTDGSCDAGLTNILGYCAACGRDGLLVCDGAQCNPGFKADVAGFCQPVEQIAEPDCDCATVNFTQDRNHLSGFVDMHAHIFSNLAFGGALIWGEAFSPLGINEALRQDDYVSRWDVVNRDGSDRPPFGFLGEVAHGIPEVDNPIGFATDFFSRPLHDHSPLTSGRFSGAPDFAGWPSWTTTTHQQMYYKWLERAYKGGLRLTVQLAVTNQLFCNVLKRQKGFNCTEMDSIDRQIEAAYDMQTYIDSLHGGTGKGWFRIVKSASEARDVITQQKLAVVLGIETSFLFGCKPGQCSESTVDEMIDTYYDKGVRYVFPVHVFNNAFGGAALSDEMINIGNYLTTGSYFNTWDCSDEGYDFKFSTSKFNQLLTLGLFGGTGTLPTYTGDAHCNWQGLTSLGEHMIPRLMAKNMIIDTDHMSNRTFDRVMDIAEAADYPVTASHLQFFTHQGISERIRSDDQVQRIIGVGGMVAMGVFGAGSSHKVAEDGIEPECSQSSEYFASGYQHAIKLMAESPLGINAVAMGTDFNGMTHHPAPRFGAEACTSGKTGLSAPRIEYPFNDGRFGTFDKQKTGKRTFNYNEDGFAHVGLTPDFIQDLRQLGVTEAELDPLYNSAEGFVQMWEKIEAFEERPPTITVTRLPATSDWVSEPVQVSISAERGTDGAEITKIVIAMVGAENRAVHDPGSEASLTLNTEGVTNVYIQAHSASGELSEWYEFSVKIDLTAPDITVTSLPEPNENNWYKGNVTVEYTCSDTLSGLTNTFCTGSRTLSTEGENQTLSLFAQDNAGNLAEYKVTGLNIDKTVPMITRARSPVPNAADWNNEAVTVIFTCSDAVSGVARCPDSETVSTEGRFQRTPTVEARDLAGNRATAYEGNINIDTTPPTLSISRLTPPNQNGWNNTDVRFSYSCEDDASGVRSCTGDEVLATEGEGQRASGSATDVAGNVAIVSEDGINIDKTPPSITAVRSPPANAAGWNNVDVTVTYDCSDTLSGVETCTPPVVLAEEGDDQAATGHVTDLAGNGNKVFIGDIRIDKTPPVITYLRDPVANEYGWSNVDVDVIYSCSDALSGILSCSDNLTFRTEGDNQQAVGTVIDLAENQAEVVVTGINIDLTPPDIRCSPMPAEIWPPNNKFKPVHIDVSLSDNLSGIQGFVLTGLTNSQGTLNDVRSFELHTDDVSGEVLATRNGGAGRTYGFVYESTDRAGNSSPCNTSVTVPVSQGK